MASNQFKFMYYQSRYGVLWEFIVFKDFIEVCFDYSVDKDDKQKTLKGANYCRHGMDENGVLNMVDPEGGPFIMVGEHCPTVANSVVTKIEALPPDENNGFKTWYTIYYSTKEENNVEKNK